jgi:hypothetical protein
MKKEEEIALVFDDEVDHLEMINSDVDRYLSQAKNAAMIALRGLSSLERPLKLNDTQALEMLLLAKSAKDIRFAVIGLRLGYYSGANAVLRSALDALAFAALFWKEKGEVAKWFRNGLPLAEARSQSDEREATKHCNEQARKARRTLLEWEEKRDCSAIKEGMDAFVYEANQQIHPTIYGLAVEFGIEIADLCPDGLVQAFENCDKDIVHALNLYALKSNQSQENHNLRLKRQLNESDEEIDVQLTGRYDEAMISELSVFAFYIAHHILDRTKELFNPKDNNFRDEFKGFHREISED